MHERAHSEQRMLLIQDSWHKVKMLETTAKIKKGGHQKSEKNLV
jgi:hypothetical protein